MVSFYLWDNTVVSFHSLSTKDLVYGKAYITKANRFPRFIKEAVRVFWGLKGGGLTASLRRVVTHYIFFAAMSAKEGLWKSSVISN